MKKISITFTLTLILFSFLSFSQTECSQYHRKNCMDKEGQPMKYDSQSKSAILGKGQISEFHMVAYHDLDYRITVCSEENLGNQIQFKIYEKKRVLIKPEKKEAVTEEETPQEEEYSEESYEEYSEEEYSEDAYSEETVKTEEPKHKMVKELLYDNADDGFKNKIEFTAEGSMSLIVEVDVPGSESKSKLKIREMGCVGVLIEHAKARKAGF